MFIEWNVKVKYMQNMDKPCEHGIVRREPNTNGSFISSYFMISFI
jgi:hypothetical protein